MTDTHPTHVTKNVSLITSLSCCFLQDCIDSRLLVELVFQPSAQCCATLDMQTLDELIMLHATMLMMQGWVHKIV